jgi:hypothetical protein
MNRGQEAWGNDVSVFWGLRKPDGRGRAGRWQSDGSFADGSAAWPTSQANLSCLAKKEADVVFQTALGERVFQGADVAAKANAAPAIQRQTIGKHPTAKEVKTVAAAVQKWAAFQFQPQRVSQKGGNGRRQLSELDFGARPEHHVVHITNVAFGPATLLYETIQVAQVEVRKMLRC